MQTPLLTYIGNTDFKSDIVFFTIHDFSFFRECKILQSNIFNQVELWLAHKKQSKNRNMQQYSVYHH